MLDKKSFAQLIISLGEYEGYNTSLVQTEKNLSSEPKNQIFSQPKDKYVFEDLVKAIDYAQGKTKVTLEVLKGVNGKMDSGQPCQPERPGILRNQVEIHVDDYTPALSVTKAMVQNVLSVIQSATIPDSWEMYARLAKLQPFDNGNKRTALIRANINRGAFSDSSKEVLLIPTDYRRSRFNTNLIEYYMAGDWNDHLPDEKESLKVFVDYTTRCTLAD